MKNKLTNKRLRKFIRRAADNPHGREARAFNDVGIHLYRNDGKLIKPGELLQAVGRKLREGYEERGRGNNDDSNN